MRLHDRHSAPVSGINCLTGVRYRVHEDDDSVDDSDYSLADDGEAEHQRSSRRKHRRRPKPVQRKAHPDADDDSLSSEDGSFFTLKSRSSTVARSEIMIQQLSFDYEPPRDGLKDSVILTISPNLAKRDDMLMSDDDDEFQEHKDGRIHLDPARVIDSGGLFEDDFDDNSSAMSSLLGEEHLFLGRTESSASLAGFSAPDNRDMFKDPSSSAKLLQSNTKNNPIIQDQRYTNNIHKTLVAASTKYPPIPATLSTDSLSSDEILRPKRMLGNIKPIKYQRPRDRLDSAASSSSLMFNYSDGEASLAANVDPKSHNLLPKRRLIQPSNQTRPTDGNKETDNRVSLNLPATIDQNFGKSPSTCDHSASGSSIPDNDIPAIKSLASASSSRDSKYDSVSYRESPLQVITRSNQQLIENDHNYLSVVEEKDVSIGPDLVLDDIDWDAPIDHSFTTVDTPPFFTISIPKNWKQHEENKDHSKKKGKSNDSTKGRNGKVSKGIPENSEKHNRGQSISFRGMQSVSSTTRRERGQGASDRSRSRSSSKPRFWQAQNQDIEKNQINDSKATGQIHLDAKNPPDTSKSKLSSIGDDNRSVSSHHTFWSTQSDGLLAQRRVKDGSNRKIKGEDNAKDDNKSVQSKNSFSSFRSFFSSRSWKASKRLKSKAHRSRKAESIASKDKANRWTWILSIFGGKKAKTHPNATVKKKSKPSAINSQPLDEDMTTPTAEMSDLSFLSNNLNETFLSENGTVSITGKAKYIPPDGFRTMESSKHKSSLDITDGVKPPKPTRQQSAPHSEGNLSVAQNENINVMIYQVSADRNGENFSKGSSSLRTGKSLVSTEPTENMGRTLSKTLDRDTRMKLENERNPIPGRTLRKDIETTKTPTMAKIKTSEQRVTAIVPERSNLDNALLVVQAPNTTRNEKLSLVTDRQIPSNRSENKSPSPQPRSHLNDHRRIAQSTQSAKMTGGHSSPIPKPPPSHQRCSSVGSSRSVLSASSRGSVHSNASSTSRGSLHSKASSVVSESSRNSNLSAPNPVQNDQYKGSASSVTLSSLRNGKSTATISSNAITSKSPINPYPRKSVSSSDNSVVSNGSYVSASSIITPTHSGHPSAVRSPASQNSRRSIQSSGSSVVSRGSSVISRESHLSNSSTISRSTAGSLGSTASKKSVSSKSSVASWSSRGSWETVSTRDPCARPSKIVRKSSHLQQLTEKGDGDVWVETLYKSKRTDEYKVYFVSTNTGKRSRDEPPSGASKVIYRDYDARFH